MTVNVESVPVKIEQKNGWFFATSEELTGLVLATRTKEELLEDLPAAVRLLIREKRKAGKPLY